MFKPAIYENVWIRRVPLAWDGRTDIRPTTIANNKITVAVFVFKDLKILFLPMSVIREVVSGLSPGKNGSLIFTIDIDAKELKSKITTIKAEMILNIPQSDRTTVNIFEGFEYKE
jgi:hypothetical protein